jgi:tetratricopeptide (TPR) repeat protein
MRRASFLLPIVLVGVSSMPGCNSQDATETDDRSLFDAGSLGTVVFPVSCNTVAAERMAHGLAVLHHMMYTEADLIFESAVEADPSCAIGYWGRAMTLIHPGWPDVPTAAQLQQGAELVQQALAAEPSTEREKAYIDAVGGYFQDAEQRTEVERLASFHQGWQRVHERFPEDPEAAAFYALASLAQGWVGLADASEVSMAGAAQMKELLKKIPDHPGAHHYAIHAYDNLRPDAWALEVARSYGKLAPDVPHALHMPTHIFNSLGLWSESIELNKRSEIAAYEQGRQSMGLDNHYPHALSYLVYAYLQTGQDARAQQIVERVTSIEDPISQLNRMVFAWHLAGIPVRYTLERHAWEEAAQLKVRATTAFPWDEYPQFDALTYYARTIGSARVGDAAAAGESIAALRAALEQAGPQGTASWLIWDAQTLLMAAEAWVDYANEDFERAVTRMAAAAERSFSASIVGPGELFPAGEQLADMYLELGRHDEAMTSYEAVLNRIPNRFNSLYGAGKSAELAGDMQQAMSYYQKLVEQSASEEPERENLRHARAFLAAH